MYDLGLTRTRKFYVDDPAYWHNAQFTKNKAGLDGKYAI